MKVWMRWETKERALASAGRLSAQYGRGRFAVIGDGLVATHPFAVVSATSVN